MTYHFLHLVPGATVPPQTLGLGVTSPELARLCDLGNVSGEWTDLAEAVRAEVGIAGRDVDVIRHWQGRSLVEIATMGALPPDGTTLALGRLDLPTVAAAAVLVLRRLGLVPLPGVHAGSYAEEESNAAFMARIERIAARCAYCPTTEWQPRPLPTLAEPWPAYPRTVEEDRELAAVAAICGAPLPEEPHSHVTPTATFPQSSGLLTFGGRPRCDTPVAVERRLLLAERVAVVACWLLEGERFGASTPGKQAMINILVACDAIGLNVAREVAAVRERVEASRRALAEEAGRLGVLDAVLADGTLYPADLGDGRAVPLAIVRSSHPDALSLGFCVAPVVVWIDTSFALHAKTPDGRARAWRSEQRDDFAQWAIAGAPTLCPSARVTIAGWAGANGATRYLDVQTLGYRLKRLEHDARIAARLGDDRSSWGMGYEKCCSPSDGGTLLSEEAIVGEVLQCLR